MFRFSFLARRHNAGVEPGASVGYIDVYSIMAPLNDLSEDHAHMANAIFKVAAIFILDRVYCGT